MSGPPPNTRDDFQILQELGQGSYGTVYLAHRKDGTIPVALKSCPTNSTNHASEMALNEGHVLQKLSHPNIIQCYGIHTCGSEVLLELEYARGEPLSQIIRSSRPLREDFIRSVIHQLASALDYLSSQGIVHFDVKPSNIIINKSESPMTLKLIDFGFAESREQSPPAYALAGGTQAFIAPEVIQNNPRSFPLDIWSLGVTLYQMAMGERWPCEAARLWREGFPRIKKYSKALVDLCDRMLKVDPFDRITAREIVDVLSVTQPRMGMMPIQVQFKGKGEEAERSVLLPPTATVEDLLCYTERHGMIGDKVKMNGEPVEATKRLSDYPNTVFEIEGDEPQAGQGSESRQVDIAFVIDATASMDSALQAVRDTVPSTAIRLSMCDRWASVRYACVCYRDPVDCPNTEQHEVCDFMDDPLKVSEFILGIDARGGGDTPEDFVGAVEEILKLHWRPQARGSIFWIADAPAHGMRYSGDPKHQEREPLLEPLICTLAENGINLIAVLLNDSAKRTFKEFKTIYKRVGGNAVCRIEKNFPLTQVEFEATGCDIARSLDSAVLGAERILLRADPKHSG